MIILPFNKYPRSVFPLRTSYHFLINKVLFCIIINHLNTVLKSKFVTTIKMISQNTWRVSGNNYFDVVKTSIQIISKTCLIDY